MEAVGLRTLILVQSNGTRCGTNSKPRTKPATCSYSRDTKIVAVLARDVRPHCDLNLCISESPLSVQGYLAHKEHPPPRTIQ